MSVLDLDAIEARADAATPEPWVFYNRTLWIGGMTLEQLEAYDNQKDPDETTWKDSVDSFEPTRDEDGEFIAHVRADVFDLIDRIRNLEVIQSRVRSALLMGGQTPSIRCKTAIAELDGGRA